MFQGAQRPQRNADVGQRPDVSRKPSAESSRSSASQAPYSGEYTGLDTPDAGSRSSGQLSGKKGDGVSPSILRNRQIDTPQEVRAGLPAEKGFPIQIGSELFRLSGTSIMSDCELPCPRWVLRRKLRVLEHPLTFQNSSKSNYGKVKTILVESGLYTLTEIRQRFETYAAISKVSYNTINVAGLMLIIWQATMYNHRMAATTYDYSLTHNSIAVSS